MHFQPTEKIVIGMECCLSGFRRSNFWFDLEAHIIIFSFSCAKSFNYDRFCSDFTRLEISFSSLRTKGSYDRDAWNS